MAQITLRNYLQETEDAIRDDRIEDAFTHCQNILTQFPESLEAQRLLGEAYLAQGQLEDAQQSFDWILTNDPENVVAYCNRALICERSSDYDTALDCYQQAYELSHGNSQIRQEFNRLSAETGSQGFMFSRAGLARLYMRGDLLTQAIQEWETVLAVSPERLDARTGLLETCWREAHYDRVEQLATQILQDVPGCLKALFLLAYVNSAKNVQQAQNLLKRAEALDPDLLMAQELFSGMMARQPAEPFLQLLKKAPVTVGTGAAAAPVPQEAISAQETYVPTMAMSSETLNAWNAIGEGAPEGWSNDVTLIKGTQEKQQALEPSPIWAADTNSTLDVWSVLEGPQGAGSLQELQNVSAQLQGNANDSNPLSYSQSLGPVETSSQQEEQSLETWPPDPLLNVTAENNQEEDELPLWNGSRSYDGLQEPALTDSGIWANVSKEGSMPSPPAWLNMLTQNEIRQLNDGEVSDITPIEEESVASPSPVQSTRKEKPVVTPPLAIDEEEAFSFGPEWLKSLGAASIEDGTALAEASPVLSSASDEVSQPSPVSQVYEPEPATYEAPVDEPQWQGFSENFAAPSETVEYDVLATLEGLEAGLRSQGFVPLEPNTLQALAKMQEPSSPAVPKTPELANFLEEAYQHESLPSALAEPGSFVQEPENVFPVVASPATSALMTPDTSSEEPAWLASLNTVPTPSPLAERQSEVHFVQPTQPLPDMSSWSRMDRSQEVLAAQPSPPSASLETGAMSRQPSTNDFLLNSELETTMKRPAVRLQPMPYSFAQNDRVPPPARTPMAEATYGGRNTGGNASYQERLLKGYQHQLVGDYDEAMQEYRIIIRNSPELLGEVVSNVRALLKLAPKYSTGYRVLGDAYMRQGEYLQAMEAYNKALTMAKKAKS